MRTFIFLFSFLVCKALTAQTTPSFNRYDVGNSGCAIYLPAQPAPAVMEFSPDSAKVWTIEALDSSMNAYYHFGAIVVQLSDGNADEQLLTSYLDYLKGSFEITSSDGYVTGYSLPANEKAKGIKDKWVDKDGDIWKIMAWQVGTEYMIVQFEYGPSSYPNSDVMDTFFKGIRFPGD